MKKTTLAHLAVICTNLFFAANFSLIKSISPSLIKPFGLNLYRVGVCFLLFWVAWMLSKKKPGIKRKDLGRFFLCGLTGVAINQMLFIKGLTLTSTVHASLLMLTTPLLITLFALWVLKESLTLTTIVGLVAGIGGSVVLISSKENVAHAPDYLLGDILIVLNAISYSIYFILVKPLMKTYSALHVVRWVFTFGFLLILPFGFSQASEVSPASFNYYQLAALAAIILLGTFLAYLFNAYGISHLGAGVTGSYIYSQPVFAVAIASFIVGENITWVKIVAAILIFTGVYLVSLKNKASTENIS